MLRDLPLGIGQIHRTSGLYWTDEGGRGPWWSISNDKYDLSGLGSFYDPRSALLVWSNSIRQRVKKLTYEFWILYLGRWFPVRTFSFSSSSFSSSSSIAVPHFRRRTSTEGATDSHSAASPRHFRLGRRPIPSLFVPELDRRRWERTLVIYLEQ